MDGGGSGTFPFPVVDVYGFMVMKMNVGRPFSNYGHADTGNMTGNNQL